MKFIGSQGSLLSASSDHTARLWVAGDDGAYASAAVLKTHSAEVRRSATGGDILPQIPPGSEFRLKIRPIVTALAKMHFVH